MPNAIDITYIVPSVGDYLRLRREGNLTVFSHKAAEIGLNGTFFADVLPTNCMSNSPLAKRGIGYLACRTQFGRIKLYASSQ